MANPAAASDVSAGSNGTSTAAAALVSLGGGAGAMGDGGHEHAPTDSFGQGGMAATLAPHLAVLSDDSGAAGVGATAAHDGESRFAGVKRPRVEPAAQAGATTMASDAKRWRGDVPSGRAAAADRGRPGAAGAKAHLMAMVADGDGSSEGDGGDASSRTDSGSPSSVEVGTGNHAIGLASGGRVYMAGGEGNVSHNHLVGAIGGAAPPSAAADVVWRGPDASPLVSQVRLSHHVSLPTQPSLPTHTRATPHHQPLAPHSERGSLWYNMPATALAGAGDGAGAGEGSSIRLGHRAFRSSIGSGITDFSMGAPSVGGHTNTIPGPAPSMGSQGFGIALEGAHPSDSRSSSQPVGLGAPMSLMHIDAAAGLSAGGSAQGHGAGDLTREAHAYYNGGGGSDGGTSITGSAGAAAAIAPMRLDGHGSNRFARPTAGTGISGGRISGFVTQHLDTGLDVAPAAAHAPFAAAMPPALRSLPISLLGSYGAPGDDLLHAHAPPPLHPHRSSAAAAPPRSLGVPTVATASAAAYHDGAARHGGMAAALDHSSIHPHHSDIAAEEANEQHHSVRHSHGHPPAHHQRPATRPRLWSAGDTMVGPMPRGAGGHLPSLAIRAPSTHDRDGSRGGDDDADAAPGRDGSGLSTPMDENEAAAILAAASSMASAAEEDSLLGSGTAHGADTAVGSSGRGHASRSRASRAGRGHGDGAHLPYPPSTAGRGDVSGAAAVAGRWAHEAAASERPSRRISPTRRAAGSHSMSSGDAAGEVDGLAPRAKRARKPTARALAVEEPAAGSALAATGEATGLGAIVPAHASTITTVAREHRASAAAGGEMRGRSVADDIDWADLQAQVPGAADDFDGSDDTSDGDGDGGSGGGVGSSDGEDDEEEGDGRSSRRRSRSRSGGAATRDRVTNRKSRKNARERSRRGEVNRVLDMLSERLALPPMRRFTADSRAREKTAIISTCIVTIGAMLRHLQQLEAGLKLPNRVPAHLVTFSHLTAEEVRAAIAADATDTGMLTGRRERKNERERLRRIEVNNAYDYLTALLHVRVRNKADKLSVVNAAYHIIDRVYRRIMSLESRKNNAAPEALVSGGDADATAGAADEAARPSRSSTRIAAAASAAVAAAFAHHDDAAADTTTAAVSGARGVLADGGAAAWQPPLALSGSSHLPASLLVGSSGGSSSSGGSFLDDGSGGISAMAVWLRDAHSLPPAATAATTTAAALGQPWIPGSAGGKGASQSSTWATMDVASRV